MSILDDVNRELLTPLTAPLFNECSGVPTAAVIGRCLSIDGRFSLSLGVVVVVVVVEGRVLAETTFDAKFDASVTPFVVEAPVVFKFDEESDVGSV